MMYPFVLIFIIYLILFLLPITDANFMNKYNKSDSL